MKLTEDFYNKVGKELKDKFFSEVVHGKTENKNYYKHKYTLELYSNGCTTYSKLIKDLSKYCNSDTVTIHNIIKKYVDDFEGFEYVTESKKLI